MTQSIQEVMVRDPICMAGTDNLVSAARAMRDAGIGDVTVEEGGELYGIVTDRDIVVRAVADDGSPEQVTLMEICSRDLTTLSPSSSVEDALMLMRDRALRRLPVLDDRRPVGIVSIGDLARERDPSSALAAISKAPRNS
jgi:CBS domain-containing protein